MNRLTDRLQLIADKIQKGETMADIGTDHGFLPLYLWKEGISPRVIMCDISEPSLAKAKAAAGAYQFGNELDFRAGDGLMVLNNGEVDDIVIAGMGGVLMTEIIGEDPEKSRSYRRFVLQPRNNTGILRHWLRSNGYRITANDLVREGKFICEIITAEPDKTTENANTGLPGAEDPAWELPPELETSYPELYREFAGVKAGIEGKILNGLRQSSSSTEEEIARVERRMEYFQKIAE